MRSSRVMIGSLALLLAGPLLAQVPRTPPPPPPGAPVDSGDPPARVARVGYALGNVSFQPSGDTGWSMATVNYPVTSGDRLYADRGARAELQVGSLAVRMAQATDLTMTDLTEQLVQMGLAQGSVRVTIYKLDPGDSVELDTPRGALFLLQPGAYRVDAPAGGDAMIVTVEHGSLQWTAGGVAQTVAEGQAIQVTEPTRSMIFPICALLSISRWAAAASASGNSLWITGAQRPASSAGHTLARRSSAMAPFCAVLRGRMVEPVTVSRRVMIFNRSSFSVRDPPRNAMNTSRPSMARERIFFSA